LILPGSFVSKDQDQFESLFDAQSRNELRSRLSSLQVRLSLPQAQRLTAHAESLAPALLPLRIAIAHTYTSEMLNPWLDLAGALEGFKPGNYHAPYGMILQEAQPNSGLVTHRPDVTVLLLRREDLHPALARPLAALDPPSQESLRQEALESLRAMLTRFRKLSVGHLVLTVLPSLLPSGLGIYDVQSERSESAWWAVFKAEAAQFLRESVQASSYLDLDQILLQLGRDGFFDPRLWYSATFPFTAGAASELARRIVVVGAVTKLPKAKVIALDADNTLWGGIIGEDGINGIALGPDYPGNVYVEFQRRLLEYQQRGFILALCSKNNAVDVEQVLKEHPHQLLREGLFAARRVNWQPKAENLTSLAEELNLGLESFVFVDDSEHECASVRQQLPQVEVVCVPTKPVLIPGCLDKVARLEVLSLTAEDLAKTQLYAQESKRRLFQANSHVEGLGTREYLASLQMKMRIGIDDPTNVVRLAQLTQKTNQFNLTTHRYNEQQMRELVESRDWIVAHFSLSDIFGHSGIVGLALFRLHTAEQVELETFLMSCRVIGREAESAFLNALLGRLQSQGITEVLASFIPTPKNGLASRFLAEQGFHEYADGKYSWSFAKGSPKPDTAFPLALEFENRGAEDTAAARSAFVADRSETPPRTS
jgi:FkbH-like protein